MAKNIYKAGFNPAFGKNTIVARAAISERFSSYVSKKWRNLDAIGTDTLYVYEGGRCLMTYPLQKEYMPGELKIEIENINSALQAAIEESYKNSLAFAIYKVFGWEPGTCYSFFFSL